MRLLSFAAAALLLPGTAIADGAALDAEEVEFVRLINEYRAENGLPCLSISPTMNAAADYMSRAMAEQEFFSHNEPPCDADSCSGRDPFERIRDFGHDGWRAGGENIAAGYETAAQVFAGWRASPGHNANMLGADFTAMGIARVVVPESPFRIYWTNDFSDLVDGPLTCDDDGLPPVGYGAPDGGTGGSGGSGGGSGGGGSGHGGGDGAADDDERGGAYSTGCSSGAGGISLLGFAAAALLRRRR